MLGYLILIDLPRPINRTSFMEYNVRYVQACKKVALASMQKAVNEETQLTGSKFLAVSGDRSWRTQGFQSKQGVVTLCGDKTRKVLDVSIRNLFCKKCSFNEKRMT